MPTRGYQEDVIAGVAADRRRVLVSAPCGAGKTHIAGELIRREVERGGRAVFVCDRIAIISQTIRRFTEAGLPVGVLWADETRDEDAPCLLASAQTVLSRGADALGRRTLAILDEAHVDRRASYDILRRVTEGGGQAVGLTGTPLGRACLSERWDRMVSAPPMARLAEQGWAVVPEVLARWTPDEDELDDLDVGPGGREDGEWTAASGGEMMARFAEHVADDVSAWTSGEGLPELPRTILFGATQRAARVQMEALAARGIRCGEIFDGTPRRIREERIAALESGALQVLGSVSALSVGFDSPAAEVMIGLRPLRRSVAEWLQSAGRIARPYAGKTRAVVLDYTGNAGRFGAYAKMAWEQGWDDLPAKAPKKIIRSWVCPKCDIPNPPHRQVCLECGEPRPGGGSPWPLPVCPDCATVQKPGATVCEVEECQRPLPAKTERCGRHGLPLQYDELTRAEVEAGCAPRRICPHPGCDWVEAAVRARREQQEVAARKEREAEQEREERYRDEMEDIMREVEAEELRGTEPDPGRADRIIAAGEESGAGARVLTGSRVRSGGTACQAWVTIPSELLYPWVGGQRVREADIRGARVQDYRGRRMGRLERRLSHPRESRYDEGTFVVRALLVETLR